MSWKSCICRGLTPWLSMAVAAAAPQDIGSIRGVVHDKDFDVPMGGVKVLNLGTEQTVETSDQGNYVFSRVPAGKYTLVFSKNGYVKQVRSDVVVSAGQLTDLDVWMPGDFTEMEEFVVEENQALGAGTELALLELRLESPALLDSISADLMSRAGASDAAGALRLVAGATVKDGKTAVIRGLPDRYVSSQLNGVRLPSADEDKRAVELDQFPAAIIDSIQVSKTFTPDQQGDASGGAVDVRLKGLPTETTFFVKGDLGYNSQTTGRSDFLSYEGGGVNYWGNEESRAVQPHTPAQDWQGAVGVNRQSAPLDSKYSLGGGTSWDLNDDWRLGVFGSFYHENDSSFFDDGVEDSLWVEFPGGPLTPQYSQGAPSGSDPEDGDFDTKLFDVTQGKESVQWAALGLIGLESDEHYLGITYLYTHTAEDVATLAENTRGKEFYFPGHDPYDDTSPGHDSLDSSPYLRFQTLQYTERTTGSLQFNGVHALPFGAFDLSEDIHFLDAEFEWVFSKSFAELDQPDKRQFASAWRPERFITPTFSIPAFYETFKPDATFSLGNLQRVWKRIGEEGTQYSAGVKWPFEQWTKTEGYLEAGYFQDRVDREFDSSSFANFGDNSSFEGDWSDPWSNHFPFEGGHEMSDPLTDINYKGRQDLQAFYGMLDLPLTSEVKVIAGARLESTEVSTSVTGELEAKWYDAEEDDLVKVVTSDPNDINADVDERDLLPAVSLVWEPTETVTVRGAYSQTIARMTFKEITPILQQEFLGGPIFIGYPDLQMSSLDNYDLRLDYRPQPGSLLSFSAFHKDIERPIEYVQEATSFTFTTPRNYPEGRLSGIELEGRKALGDLADEFEGLTVGANATFIDSEVRLTAGEIADFSDPAVQAPLEKRDMTGAPEFIYNIFLTYDIEPSDTHFGLFYNVQGETLIAGATLDDNNLIPSVYADEFESLNFSAKQGLWDHLVLTFKAKNLTNPHIETFYRSDYIDGDVTRSSFRKGIDYSITLGAEFSF